MYDPSLGRWHAIDPIADQFSSLSPYCYVGNNPIKRVDPDGQAWYDAVIGTAIGVATNIVPGSTSLRNAYTPTDASDYNNALRNTDAAAMAVGEGMVKGGGAAAAGGLAVAAVAGTASLAVVDAPVTVPVAAGALVVAEAGVATAAGGAVLMANGSANAAAGYNYGGKKDTESGSSKEALRNAKDQNGVPRSQQPDKTTTVREKGTGKPLKQYEYTNSKGEKVQIRKDNPKTYPDGGTQGNHYNAGEAGKKLDQHHNY